MKLWTDFVLPFACGLVAGVVLAFFHFRARLGFYKNFIEHRLASIHQLHFSKGSSRKLPKSYS